MSTVYVKRYRMTIPLSEVDLPTRIDLPADYYWLPWSRDLLLMHAETKYQCFHDEFDSMIFPSLGKQSGCLQLMKDISTKHTFLPDATWLIVYEGRQQREFCGTIQGIGHTPLLGSIQNVGITPGHRHKGLGRALLCQSLAGFRKFGFRSVFLEVTADNDHAVRLYRSMGFELTRTMYRTLTLRGPLH